MIYSPVFMMDHEDIVIVSLQWRLGPYGFLSTGDAASPGNYGFHDMVLGLQWVQENIHLFGGDPAKVTISGNFVDQQQHQFAIHSKHFFKNIRTQCRFSCSAFVNRFSIESKSNVSSHCFEWFSCMLLGRKI